MAIDVLKNYLGSGVQHGDLWYISQVPAVATVATASKAAGAAGVQHVMIQGGWSLSCAATAQTPIAITVRDGASGAGTVLWAWSAAALADTCVNVALPPGIYLVGSAATAMTIEFASGGTIVAAAQATVCAAGYDVQ